MKPTPFISAAILAATLSAAHAGEAVNAVRPFYTNLASEVDPQFRWKFVNPAKSKLEGNDRLLSDGETCIDWILSIDAQDYDAEVLAKTLQLSEKGDGDKATVTATFYLAENQPGPAGEVVWSLEKVDGAWKVSDIASKPGGWKLSELDCN
ncbi:hypothetical protein SAZ10_20400 [Mesorhizobium sp. BAC0120]|uniref:hypothetical protein n=1 Tax=Mesorhizobium sp. BAC0120 TaxID=3090670 RepID=UPI00298D54D4|nr:hypothetical protein [Mesorhizobium sp. BAC0120]MDW6024113.1 hypothetical protein [Mesorhizobium sp. BAC0120]